MNLVVIFTAPRYVRSYAKVLNDFSLRGNVSIKLLLPLELANCVEIRRLPKNIIVEYFGQKPLIVKFQKTLLDLHTFYYRKRSLSFESRLRLRFNISRSQAFKFSSFLNPFNPKLVFLYFLLPPYIGSITIRLIRVLFDICNLNFFWKLKSLQGDTLLFISGGPVVGYENALIRFAKLLRYRTVLLIDNWDNASSKSIYWVQPKKVITWGESMNIDMQIIHRTSQSSLTALGSVRLGIANRLHLDSQSRNQLLFVASGLPHCDEVDLVLELSKYLKKELGRKFSIIFRMHPYHLDKLSAISKLRDEGIFVYPNDVNRTHLDKSDLNESMYESDTVLSLYRQIITSKVVLGTHSTALLESLCLGVPAVAYSLAEVGPFEGASVWDSYSHLIDFRKRTNIYETLSREAFFRAVSECFNSDQEFIARGVESIIQPLDGLYSDKLIQVLNQ